MTIHLARASAAALSLAAAAAGQDVTYLAPHSYSHRAGTQASVHVESGSAPRAAAPVPWPQDRASWLFVRGGGNQENLHNPGAADGRAVEVTPALRGVTLIGVDLDPVTIEIDGPTLAVFCRDRASGDPPPAPAAARPLRVRRLESAAAIIRAEGDRDGSAIATSKTGQRAEIRMLMDPTAAIVGSDLSFRVYVEGVGQASGKLTATNITTGDTQTITADSSGIGHFAVTAAGVWRVEFHHVTPSRSEGAAWDLYSATLAFEVPPAAEEVKR